MISRKQALQAFQGYLEAYDMEDGMIRLKRDHSYRVADNASMIAESLGLNEEQQDFAWVLGLVHDIGRFDQARQFHSFLDYKTVDHGDLGEAVLLHDDYWKRYVTPEYKDVLLFAVRNHNKYEVEDTDHKELILFSKVIRDADKVDILHLRAQHSYDEILHIPRQEIEQSQVTPVIYETILSSHIVVSSQRVTALDRLVSMPALIFDLNTYWAKKRILEQNDVHRILANYTYRNEVGKRQTAEIERHCTEWLENETIGK